MDSRLRGLQPSSDWLGGQRIDPSYDWLKPCETPAACAEREGPLRRLRPTKISQSTGELVPLGANGIQGASSSRMPATKKGRGKRPDHTLWAVGAPHPNWQPPSAQEQAWRHYASTATKATKPTRSVRPRGTPARSASCPNGQLVAPERHAVRETPGVEAWDSISQRGSEPGTPCSQQQGQGFWETASAETHSQSRLRLSNYDHTDHDIHQHITRNRRGHYDHLGGRLFG